MPTDQRLREEVLETLTGLSKLCKSNGSHCASQALDDALISVFNAFFVDQEMRASSTVTHPSVKRRSEYQS